MLEQFCPLFFLLQALRLASVLLVSGQLDQAVAGRSVPVAACGPRTSSCRASIGSVATMPARKTRHLDPSLQ